MAEQNDDLPDIPEWNEGVFINELRRHNMYPQTVPSIRPPTKGKASFPHPEPPRGLAMIPIRKGTYVGSAKALIDIYSRINQRHASVFDLAGFEQIIPDAPNQETDLDDKRKKYEWQPIGTDKYPPHLRTIPREDQVGIFEIFNAARLLDVGGLIAAVLPENIVDWIYSEPDKGASIADIEKHNQELRKKGKGIYKDATIGDRADWYTDAVFAQQQFTGNNPTTIALASQNWIDQFTAAAVAQKKTGVINILKSSRDSLYVHDCSYFRTAIGAPEDSLLTSSYGPDGARYGCASVSLFQLNPDGKIHPLAIIIDYKGSVENSIVLFNRRLKPSDPTNSERTDWPWRYAKTCAQVSDWTLHELTVHLTNTHLVEEAIIVAAERSFPTNHVILQLLHPHWFKTLSLNAAARSTLLPAIIVKLSGMNPDQVYDFVQDAYKRFDFTGGYIPNDLNRRGFPVEHLETDVKFHNYAYGRNMNLMWQTLQNFVSSALSAIAPQYNTDEGVENDPYIVHWVSEMKDALKGNLRSFPDIKTRPDLVNVLTMCIHIASPQHTAVNYTQEYYQSFVLNKPPALYAPLPTTLEKLLNYNEADLMHALPINKSLQWLIAQHLPYLLSFQVAGNQNILYYALSVAKIAPEPGLRQAAHTLYTDLMTLSKIFEKHNKDLDDKKVNYNVMEPELTAVSILI